MGLLQFIALPFSLKKAPDTLPVSAGGHPRELRDATRFVCLYDFVVVPLGAPFPRYHSYTGHVETGPTYTQGEEKPL